MPLSVLPQGLATLQRYVTARSTVVRGATARPSTTGRPPTSGTPGALARQQRAEERRRLAGAGGEGDARAGEGGFLLGEAAGAAQHQRASVAHRAVGGRGAAGEQRHRRL